MKPNTNTTVESLLAKTKLMPNGCMEWQPSRDRGGYGYYMIMYKNLRAHRVMAELVYGPRPEGMVVRHSCDNPPCINPDHLSFGTVKDNVADKFARGRANTPFGESHVHSKLTAEIVIAIRAIKLWWAVSQHSVMEVGYLLPDVVCLELVKLNRKL